MKAVATRKEGKVQGDERWPARAGHLLEGELHGVEGHHKFTSRQVEYRLAQVLIAVGHIVQ